MFRVRKWQVNIAYSFLLFPCSQRKLRGFNFMNPCPDTLQQRVVINGSECFECAFCALITSDIAYITIATTDVNLKADCSKW
jgi:hypothetical protein